MSNKEAALVLMYRYIFIFIHRDVGSSMFEKFEGVSGVNTRRMDISIDCLKLMLQNKIFNYKSHEIGLILFGSEEFDDNTDYVHQIQEPNLDFVRNVSLMGEKDAPQKPGGDIFDALDKSLRKIDEYVGSKKFDKKIFLITCGCGESDYTEKQIQRLVQMVKRVDAKINLIAIDFMVDYQVEADNLDKPDSLDALRNVMFSGSDHQTPIQNNNQKLIYLMQEELRDNMRIFPAHVAMELYAQFRTKQVSARASFRGEFMLNNEVGIQVLVYKKTAEEKLPSLKKYSTVAPYNNSTKTNEVKNDSAFYIQDDPNMTPIDKENIIKGYQYGKQIVPIDSIMEAKMKYKCQRCFQLLGFVPREQVPRHYFMSGIDMVVPVDSERARKQMSALVISLIATKKVALARFVGRDQGNPKLMVLIPHKNDEYECFWMINVPTVEDIRNFQFSSLKRSTPAQQQAVSTLIDSMDLTAVIDQNDEPQEVLKMKYVVNPTRQYFQQVIMHKAITLSDTIPEIPQVILDYLRPETQVYANARPALERIMSLFKFKKNEIKKAAEKKKFWKELFENEAEKSQMADEDVVEIDRGTEELREMVAKQKIGFDRGEEITREIGSVSPLQDFIRMISWKGEDLVDSAMMQIQKVIMRIVDESIQGSLYEKAMECLKEMRKACISQMEPDYFNNFLVFLKDRYSEGSQQMFWGNVIKEGITLISGIEQNQSRVTVEQAILFLNKQTERAQAMADKLQNDEEDLQAEIE